MKESLETELRKDWKHYLLSSHGIKANLTKGEYYALDGVLSPIKVRTLLGYFYRDNVVFFSGKRRDEFRKAFKAAFKRELLFSKC